jgi:hypothetical protein
MTAIPFRSPEDRDAFLSGSTDEIDIVPPKIWRMCSA